MKSIDPADPDSPIPDFEGIDSEWYKSMSQRVREYRAWMYAREVTLSRELLRRVDAGSMSPMEFSYRLTRLGVHDIKGLCQLEIAEKAPAKSMTCAGERANGMSEPDIRHVDYPHLPGYLYDCPGCEAMCHCTADSAQCVYEGDHGA